MDAEFERESESEGERDSSFLHWFLQRLILV